MCIFYFGQNRVLWDHWYIKQTDEIIFRKQIPENNIE